MASLTLEHVGKKYPNGYEGVKDFNLEIADKEFIIFVGPSGCGKSTTLRMIAGLEDITSGTLKIDGRVVNDVEPKDRDIAMVFQTYALYPHMTVYENMAFPLKLRKVDANEIDKAVREAARILDLEKLLDRKPVRPLRRPAPARRHGPRHRPCPQGLPDGRAALQPRRQAPRPDARRDLQAARPPRRHDHLRHARPDRGHDARHPHRRHEGRRHAAGGHPHQALQRALQPVRGRLHRLPADELHRRPGEREGRWRGPHLRRQHDHPHRPQGRRSQEGRLRGQGRRHGHPPGGRRRGARVRRGPLPLRGLPGQRHGL